MLNIHPSLLPSFPGLDPQGQALRAGVKISGATVHFVIPETDAGPILMQGVVSVGDDDTAGYAGGADLRRSNIGSIPMRCVWSPADKIRIRGRCLQNRRQRRWRRYPDFTGRAELRV